MLINSDSPRIHSDSSNSIHSPFIRVIHSRSSQRELPIARPCEQEAGSGGLAQALLISSLSVTGLMTLQRFNRRGERGYPMTQELIFGALLVGIFGLIWALTFAMSGEGQRGQDNREDKSIPSRAKYPGG